jgi:predicted RNase H-like HicB family nuclease
MAILTEKSRSDQQNPSGKEALESRLKMAAPCPCCGASTIYTPVITCSHCGKELPIACYVYRKGGNFYGECLSLNIVSRGATQEEAIVRLQSAMFSYVEAVLADGKSAKGLIPRRAPLSSWIRYYLHVSKRRLARLFGSKSSSLAMKSVPAPDAITYRVVEC